MTSFIRQCVLIMLTPGMWYSRCDTSLRVPPLGTSSPGWAGLELPVHGVVVLVGAVAVVEAYRALMRRHTVTRATSFHSSAAGTVLITSTQISTLTVALVALAAPVAASTRSRCDGKRALQVRRYWGVQCR